MATKKDSLQQQPETGYDLEFADELSCPSTSNFSWPPPAGDEQRYTPTASPLYIPPPGTQHVQVTKYCDHLCFHLLALSSEKNCEHFGEKKLKTSLLKFFVILFQFSSGKLSHPILNSPFDSFECISF